MCDNETLSVGLCKLSSALDRAEAIALDRDSPSTALYCRVCQLIGLLRNDGTLFLVLAEEETIRL